MIDRRALLWGSLVGVALVRGETVSARCAVMGPERPRLLQRESVPVAPGAAFVLYLSSAVRTHTFSLQSDSGETAGLTIEPIAGGVVRARVPPGVRPGSYTVVTGGGRGASERVGRLTVGAAARSAPVAVAGRFEVMESSQGRGGPYRSLRFVLASRTLTDVVVVFRWRVGGQEKANAVWVTGDRALWVASYGRCGPSPFDLGGAPPARTPIEVAQIDATGAVGRWTSFTVP
jgi:hypothetical protein